MDDIEFQKESEKEYTVFADGICIGAYFIKEGIVLNWSEGCPVSLDTLDKVIKKLRDLENQYHA